MNSDHAIFGRQGQKPIETAVPIGKTLRNIFLVGSLSMDESIRCTFYIFVTADSEELWLFFGGNVSNATSAVIKISRIFKRLALNENIHPPFSAIAAHDLMALILLFVTL